MQYRILSTLSLLMLLAAAALPAQAAGIKCWTNKDGVRECGQTIPPEYSQKAVTEMNDQGMVVKKKARAKTEKELQEEAKKAAEEKKKKRQAEERAKQDRILLYTFSSVDDIKMVRDEQLAALESNIKVTQKRNEKIQGDLDNRIKAAAAAERAGREPSASLQKEIKSLKDQIKSNNKFIQEKRDQMKQTKKEYSDKIERFKELKGKS